MMKYPLLFGYRDVILGNGFVAGVACDGRALLSQEGPSEFWMYGVNPGGLAASGADHSEANKAFRQGYTAVLFDIAAAAKSFAEFEAQVRRFFDETNAPTEREWLEAVQAVRAGAVSADWLVKRPAETPRGIHVEEIRKPKAKDNELDAEEALASPVAA